MQSITIKGSKRESVGKKATKALRNADKVPCVIYGGEQPIHFSADEISFKQLVYTPHVYIASIEMEDGNKYDAIVQDLQFHPVTDRLLHVDFYQLHDDKPVMMDIPVKLEGTPLGVKNGGVLRFPNRKLSITALPKDLPDFIHVNIEKLKIGDKFLISDIETDKYKFNQSENMVVAQVRMARAAITTEAEEDEEDEGEAAEGAETTDTPEATE